MLRSIALLCLVLSVFAVEQAPLEANTPLERTNGGIQKFNAGKRIPGDKLIWSGTGHQIYDYVRMITMDVQFPQYEMTNNAVISQISITTMLDTGDSQFKIVSGGVGQKSAGLQIVSNNAHKISYKIEIYGK